MRIVQADCRKRFNFNDLHFIARCLSSSGTRREPTPPELEGIRRLVSDPAERDRLLDEPALFDGLLDQPSPVPLSMQFYFYLVVRRALMEAGLDDRNLADYIASVLAEFAARQSGAGGEDSGPESPPYAVDAAAAIEEESGYRRFALITHLGNQTLVWTGVFPERLEHRRQRRAAPGIAFYEAVGTAQYRAAREHSLAGEFELRSIYTHLAEHFGEVRSALTRMRDRYLHLGGPSFN